MQQTRHPQSWLETFQAHSQSLAPAESHQLANQIAQVDWDQVASLVDTYVLGQGTSVVATDTSELKPASFVALPQTESEHEQMRKAAEHGEKMLDQGRVGVVIVAGGQGSRLGYDGPKGVYPIGSISGASLFYFHARKVVALTRRYNCTIPLLIMTSPENDAQTRQHFEENAYFGLNPTHVRFFQQGQMPAVDRTTGDPLFAGPAKLALSPDGHGGCLYAMARKDQIDGLSALQWVESFGVSTLFYYQVDNPMVLVADPVFLGLHHDASADVSFKVVSKQTPEEKVGVVCTDPQGRKLVIEYSDLPDSMAQLRNPAGQLLYRAGSIAVHIFETAFLKRLASGETKLPFHKALKKVPYWDMATNKNISPSEPNAVKFEAFIFDTLPLAERSVIVETDRKVEFEPLKNATGPDSPETVRAALSRAAADSMEAASLEVKRNADGTPLQTIELDPCLAMFPDQLIERLPANWASLKKVLIRE